MRSAQPHFASASSTGFKISKDAFAAVHDQYDSILLKGLEARGFMFFTNLEGRKARELAENPKVALHFPWLELERQVIVTGKAERISIAETLRGSQRATRKRKPSPAVPRARQALCCA
ncbi:MAG: pyridoxamine 5'-phosphate oxidase family protein [Verrucomicrobiota bacterium]